VGLIFLWQDTAKKKKKKKKERERCLPLFWSTRGFTVSLCTVLVGLVVRYQCKEIKMKLVVSWIKVINLAQLDLKRIKSGFNSVKLKCIITFIHLNVVASL